VRLGIEDQFENRGRQVQPRVRQAAVRRAVDVCRLEGDNAIRRHARNFRLVGVEQSLGEGYPRLEGGNSLESIEKYFVGQTARDEAETRLVLRGIRGESSLRPDTRNRDPSAVHSSTGTRPRKPAMNRLERPAPNRQVRRYGAACAPARRFAVRPDVAARFRSGQDGNGDRQQRPCQGHFRSGEEPRRQAGCLCCLSPSRRSRRRPVYVALAGMHNAKSRNKRAAFLFLVWATSKPTSLQTAAAGLAATRVSAWSSEGFKKAFGAQAAAAALTNLQNADVDRAKAILFHPQSRPIQDAFMIGVNEVATGAKSAKSAMTTTAEKANAAIRG
jgi:hypothetical protein